MGALGASRAGRLDHYVIQQLPELSRASATHLIEEGRVLINGQTATKPGYKVRPKDQITIHYQPSEMATVPDIELPIIYEDKTCVVINKPTGVLVHSKGSFNPEATVATWLHSRVKNLTGERAGIVHRLDRATSGVMICAKTPEALTWLQKQFSLRKTQKTYQAIVSGVPAKRQAIIDMPIERNPKKPQTFRVGANGKPAVTTYRVLQTHDQLSLLELQPTTGRTHQLRVHLQHIGHPIVGDSLYGGQTAKRLFLYAQSLGITLPNKTHQVFEVPTPTDFEERMKI